jgi:hypothetical protein
MRDGDTYQVCCTCGTEFLQRTMCEAARDLWQCARCFDLDNYRRGQVTEADDWDADDDTDDTSVLDRAG